MPENIEIYNSIKAFFGGGTKIETVSNIGGGNICTGYKIKVNDRYYFLKSSHKPVPKDFFKREAEGLDLLWNTNKVRTPKVIHVTDNYLLLEWIDSTPSCAEAQRKAGEQLAALHKLKQDTYGLNTNSYIGTLPLENGVFNDWPTFYFNYRLLPVAKVALEKGNLFAYIFSALEEIGKKINDIVPNEKPSLLHGDLWGGNVLFTSQHEPVFIDPSVYFGHREVDIAMTMLFGGFDTAFYEAYYSCYPLLPDFRKRIPIYQLYPLLVHAALFGGYYQLDCMNSINVYL